MGKLAVTGLTGKKSGGAFLQRLVLNRLKIASMFPEGITAVVRESSNVEAVSAAFPDATVARGNLSDSVFLAKSFENVDTCVHIAGIDFSPSIADAAVKSGVRRLILVHTTGIYSKHKAAGERYREIDEYVHRVCRENNILLSILRPTMIYGNIGDMNVIQFISMVDRFPIMPVVNGAKYELQPVHYEDLAQAYIDVLLNEEKTAGRDFVLSGGEPILLRDMLSVIGTELGKKVKFISCPYFIAYTGAWLVYLLSLKKQDFREKVQRLCEPRAYSHKEASEAFGYAPRTFAVGIKDEVKEYLTNKGTK